MRMIRPLDDILGRRSTVAILRLLVQTRLESSGRQIAQAVGMDHRSCMESLWDLDAEDIVRIRRVGKSCFIQLNRAFPLVKDVLVPLFEWERELPKRFEADIVRIVGPAAASVVLYGSTAKGTDEWNSDVDLLLVAWRPADLPRLDRSVDDLIPVLMDNYRRVPETVRMDLKEFRTRMGEKDTFLSEIVRTGRVLHGLRMEDLIHEPAPHRLRRGSAK